MEESPSHLIDHSKRECKRKSKLCICSIMYILYLQQSAVKASFLMYCLLDTQVHHIVSCLWCGKRHLNFMNPFTSCKHMFSFSCVIAAIHFSLYWRMYSLYHPSELVCQSQSGDDWLFPHSHSDILTEVITLLMNWLAVELFLSCTAPIRCQL